MRELVALTQGPVESLKHKVGMYGLQAGLNPSIKTVARYLTAGLHATLRNNNHSFDWASS